MALSQEKWVDYPSRPQSCSGLDVTRAVNSTWGKGLDARKRLRPDETDLTPIARESNVENAGSPLGPAVQDSAEQGHISTSLFQNSPPAALGHKENEGGRLLVSGPCHSSTPVSVSFPRKNLCPQATILTPQHPPPGLTATGAGDRNRNVAEFDELFHLETPPLTPDTFNKESIPPSILQNSHEEDDENAAPLYLGIQLQDIKEGKQPDRSLDLENDPEDDQDEWIGLKYTIEVSSRGRQPSETHSYSAGEHSKSRESWAAIHGGTVHPFFEDQDYYRWKNWHRFLDHQDERRKHKKGLAFKAHAKDQAWLFADEIKLRDILYSEKDAYGDVSMEVKEQLNYVVERRPDPYIPCQKHDFGWCLKRSRSIGCLRELVGKS